MKRVFAILAAAVFPVLGAGTLVSFAQQPAPPENIIVKQRMAQAPEGAPQPDNIIVKQRVVQAPEGPPSPDANFLFVSTEMNFEGKIVKGAPYSAQAVTETIQTLSDGNRIINKSTSSLFRDSEGRTRREQTLKLLGSLGDGGEPLQTIFINDPVAGVTYALDSRTHVAHKSAPFRLTQKFVPGGPGAPMPGGEGQRFEFRVEGAPAAGLVMKSPGAPGAEPTAGVSPEAGHMFRIQTDTGPGGPGTAFVLRRDGSSDNVKEEQLGKQNIEGVEAEGSRTTITIPAGEIGNDRPIEIVSERWYSPELQTVVMTRHSDPRSGESTYRLTNISRTEPAKSVFEVPGDYTVKEGMPGQPNVMQIQPRVRKPE